MNLLTFCAPASIRTLPLICLVLTLLFPVPGNANQEKTAANFARYCAGCHGNDGDGLGVMDNRLTTPPRDFHAGIFKITTTVFGEITPQDKDLYRMISDGMPGTSMPGWSDTLSQGEISDLVTYIKVLSGYEPDETAPGIEFANQVPSSAQSIAKGQQLYLDNKRCSECHGETGKGDAQKRLLGDNGERTWPTNLSKDWTFKASNQPADIFARISAGIPGTQMPAYSDPSSNKFLNKEEMWHVANYVNSLANDTERVNPANNVITAKKIDLDTVPTVEDELWSQLPATTFYLIPQIITGERHFSPTNDTITARAAFNDKQLFILLSWDDRTFSLPGDKTAELIAEPGLSEDAVAIQFPARLRDGMEKPYFGMGDIENPVNIWHWSNGTTDSPQSTRLMDASGHKQISYRNINSLWASGYYNKGSWQVLFQRNLLSEEVAEDLQFSEGVFIPIAFSAWDGSASEKGPRHTLTSWYWILLEPEANSWPAILALLVLLTMVGIEYWWWRSSQTKVQE